MACKSPVGAKANAALDHHHLRKPGVHTVIPTPEYSRVLMTRFSYWTISENPSGVLGDRGALPPHPRTTEGINRPGIVANDVPLTLAVATLGQH